MTFIEQLSEIERHLANLDHVQAHRDQRLDLPDLQEAGRLFTRTAGLLGKLAARAADDVSVLDLRESLQDDQRSNPQPRVEEATRSLADFVSAMNVVIGSGATYHEAIDHLSVTSGSAVPLHTQEGGIRPL